MFEKILVANRGEIACRIAKTAKRLGIKTVAVYSDVDKGAQHVKYCDEAVALHGNTPAESYLDIDRILGAATTTGAQAIHPGYGFLSENAGFAECCDQSAITFIGPAAESIRIMGAKNVARETVAAAGVPVLAGYDGENQHPDHLQQVATQIGYPLLIKAVAGGGGKGMRQVNQVEAFQSALESVKRESLTAFGDETVLLERFLPEARHIEVQVFGDHHGNIVHLYERDCSMQRRHQKVIEESPAPGISDTLRARITSAAVECARAINYRGAGTVEFLCSRDENFYFMEMNTRLQVEHPVTEMITGQDLVEWQFRIAAGGTLPCQQNEISMHGHAIETRIYAENPDTGFLPSTGKVHYLKYPDLTQNLRLDTGITTGDTITPYYDPMICKLVTWGNCRQEAMTAMDKALDSCCILGVNSNIAFLSNLVTHADFQRGPVDTGFIEKNLSVLINDDNSSDSVNIRKALDLAGIFLYLSDIQKQQDEQARQSDRWSPWAPGTDRSHLEREEYRRKFLFQTGTEQFEITLGHRGTDFYFDDNTDPLQATLNGNRLDVQSGGYRQTVMVAGSESMIFLYYNKNIFNFKYIERILKIDSGIKIHQKTDGILHSPMPGLIVDIRVKPDQSVTAGDILMVVEAMKMEHQIKAPCDGIVTTVNYSTGDQVEESAPLMVIEQ